MEKIEDSATKSEGGCMNKALLTTMLCAMSAFGLFQAAPVLAQSAVGDQGASAKQAAPAASAGAGIELAEIIVTARRVEERAQDVPISMTVFNQQQLTNRNVVNSQDLATYTPSLSANSNFGSQNSSFAIVDRTATNPAIAPLSYLPSLDLLNLNLNWNSIAGSPVDVSLFAVNVTNKQYYTYVAGLYASTNFETAALGQPRFYGARVRYKW
jgi:outer membrane receptor protein involved in Fe transport